MWGAIIGDIVGSVYEWNRIRTMDFEFFSPKGHFTDDSVCTAAVADILPHDLSAAAIAGPIAEALHGIPGGMKRLRGSGSRGKSGRRPAAGPEVQNTGRGAMRGAVIGAGRSRRGRPPAEEA